MRDRVHGSDLLSRARWYEFLPEVALVAGLGLFAITEPHAAAAGLKSTKAIVLMVSAAILWILGTDCQPAIAAFGARVKRSSDR